MKGFFPPVSQPMACLEQLISAIIPQLHLLQHKGLLLFLSKGSILRVWMVLCCCFNLPWDLQGCFFWDSGHELSRKMAFVHGHWSCGHPKTQPSLFLCDCRVSRARRWRRFEGASCLFQGILSPVMNRRSFFSASFTCFLVSWVSSQIWRVRFHPLCLPCVREGCSAFVTVSVATPRGGEGRANQVPVKPEISHRNV